MTTILLGAIFLHESLAPRSFAGMALIAAGLAAIDGRLFRRFWFSSKRVIPAKAGTHDHRRMN